MKSNPIANDNKELIAGKIALVSIDIVMVPSNDFGQFGGDRDGSPSYNAREKLVRESVLAHGKILAGPSSWQNRPGYILFQGPKSAKGTGYEKP